MRAVSRISAVALVGAIVLLGAKVAWSQQEPVSDKPLQEKWAPTEFGKDDNGPRRPSC